MEGSNDSKHYPITDYLRADPSQPPPGLGVASFRSLPETFSMEYQGFEIEITDVGVAEFAEVPEDWLSSAPVYVPRYTLGDATEFILGAERHLSPRSTYVISLRGRAGERASCIVSAGGDKCEPPGSQVLIIIHDELVMTIGNQIFSLVIPTLALRWSTQLATDACRGLYLSPDNTGFIHHGDFAITKVDFTGEVIWTVRAIGLDVFSEDFRIFPDRVEADDYNHRTYGINLLSGKATILPGR